MKLNKPKVTDTQTELENYVANLLVDSPCQVTPREKQGKEEKNSVTALLDEKQKLTEFVSGVSSENISRQEQSSKKKDVFIKEIKPNKIESPVKINTLTKESSGDVIPLTKKINKLNLFEQKENKAPSSVVRAVEPSNKVSNENLVSKAPLKPSDKKHHEKVNQEVEDYSKRTYKEPEQTDPRLKNVEKLLTKIALANVITPEAKIENVIQSKATTVTENKTEVATKAPTSTPSQNPTPVSRDQQVVEPQSVSLESAKPSFEHRESSPLKEHLGNVFQTLVFEVNKLPLAVPLVKLGGIVNVSQLEITPLVGTPDWFMGLVPNERGNLMVVDTQKFLMPERPLSENKEYQYLIILDDSNWALACHSVGDAKNLSPDDIRWSSGSSKRPWFAGMVVEYMSALIEVDELINMLADNIVD